jgi:hypothetical protein
MKKNYLLLFTTAVIILIYLPLLLYSSVGGDTVYIFNSMFADFTIVPYAWSVHAFNGIGGFTSAYNTDQLLTILIALLGTFFSWPVIVKIIYVLPFLLICFFSSYMLIKLFTHRKEIVFLSILIYMLNTYILMLLSGGQFVVALAYALVPLVIFLFIQLLYTASFRYLFLCIIIYGIQIMMDIRFAYLSAVTVGLFYGFSFLTDRRNIQWLRVLFLILPAGIGVLALQAFWLIPTVLLRNNPLNSLGSAYTTQQAVSYFSFAKFENTISLLHPNWPENIFGKVYFMRPEFLILPIIAYASLFFVKSSQINELTGLSVKNKKKSLIINSLIDNKLILFFAFLGLIGAFLAKGSNDPFGFIYLWMFVHVPGFIMFRDPTKFYTLVALSYSILIPFSLWKLSERVSSIKYKVLKDYGTFIILFVFILFWLVTIRQAVFGQLGGTFQATKVPSEYTTFANYLSSQNKFSRTLWMPTTQRFGYSSDNHPAVSAEDFFNIYNENGLIKKLRSAGAEKLLQEMGVKYIIVPTDSQKEIFLKNRAYSEALYKRTVSDVSKIKWLKPDHQIPGLAVFTVPNPKDHFYLESSMKNPSAGSGQGQESSVSYTFVNPTKYIVTVKNVHKGDRLIFAESFDPNWVATVNSSTSLRVKSQMFAKLFNSFVLPENGSFTMNVYYTPQKWVNIGAIISLLTVIVLIVLLLGKVLS